MLIRGAPPCGRSTRIMRYPDFNDVVVRLRCFVSHRAERNTTQVVGNVVFHVARDSRDRTASLPFLLLSLAEAEMHHGDDMLRIPTACLTWAAR